MAEMERQKRNDSEQERFVRKLQGDLIVIAIAIGLALCLMLAVMP